MNETYSSAVCDCASPSPPPSEEGPFTLSLDRLAGRLARLLRAPLAVILLDDDGVFWSDDGILLDRASCPWMSLLRALGREVAIASRPLVLPDLQRERPMAEAEGIAAYLGVPLLTPEGHAVGSLGVADREPRVWTEDEEETLGDFAALVAAALAGRSSDHERRRIEQEHDRLLAREREARARAERFEERFRAFLANCSEGIWCFEGEPLRVDLPEDEQLAHFYRHGYLSECNDAMARMYGFEHASQLLGRPLGEFLNPADPRSEIFLRGLIRSGYRLIDAEAHETDREGRPKVFLISLVGIIEDGLLRRVWGTQRDITAARQAELALRASEERHRIISELMSDYTSSYAVQPDGTLVPEWIAGAFQRITGYTLEEITERGWQILIHPEDRPLVAQHVERLLAGEAHVSEHRFITKAGEVIWVRNGARPVRDEATGRVVRLIGASQDITERKRAEQAMQAAREAAEAANRAKDRFLAVLSHELRTPLTPVLAETSARLDDPATPAEVRPMLDLIRRNIELEARLIDDLLDINRIASGKMTLERQAVDLHLVIQRALESCQAALRGAGLHLELDLRAEVHHVEGDPVRLQQIIWNLLKNACKFTPEGGTITVRSRREAGPRPGDWLVVVEVSDTGIGIDPAVLPTIFEAFEQGDPALSRRHDGLGLGLAICRSLAELHGGRLTATSAGRGRGSTFRLELGAIPAPAPAAPLPADGPDLRPLDQPLRVLLVEDNQDTAIVLARLLRGRGHTVTTAANLSDALAAAEAGDFDLVLSDLGLPDGSGLELLHQLRRRSPAVRGIVLSGYGMDADVRRSHEAGYAAHLTKPLDFAKLEETIRRVTS